MNSPLCSLLGIDIPILQAPTGSVAGPELAAAVSGAGGLGSLGVTWTAEAETIAHIRTIRVATARPFMLNYALSFEPVTLCAALEAGTPVVSFSWGQPGELLSLVHGYGAKTGVQVSTATGARTALESGADFLICQGIEAGGHVQSTHPLTHALSQVLAAANGAAPVVAAGGICDARGIAEALRAGADGVMLGTRFVATRESRAHPDYKRLLVEAGDSATGLTICFDGGWPHAPHRVLRNSTLDAWESAGCPPPGRRPGEGDRLGTTAGGSGVYRYEDTAPREGMAVNAEAMALYAGTGVWSIQDLPRAGEMVRRLWREATELLSAE